MGARRSAALLFPLCLGAALIAGCGGGGGSSLPPSSSQGLAPASGTSVPLVLTIAIPSGTTASAGARSPRYVSAGTKSAVIAYGGVRQTVNCAATCTATLQATVGPQTFVASLYDQPNGAGNILATGSTNVTIVAGQANAVNLTFDGVVSRLSVAFGAAGASAGTTAQIPLTVRAIDAAGYIIVGAEPYANPITLSSDDASGATTLSTRSLNSPNDAVALSYNGSGSIAAVHVTAAVPGTTVAAQSATLPIAAAPATPSPAPASTAGTLIWQTGHPTLGKYVLPAPEDGQCAGVGPTITGNDASFTVKRNTNKTYVYHGVTYPGASTCWRNQMNPIDPNTGTNVMLDLGSKYRFTFQTVVTLNGNYGYQNLPSGGIGVDIPAIVWQTHDYGGNGEPCASLVLENTYVASANGLTLFGSVAQPGRPSWEFHTCDEGDFTGHAYNSPDTLYDGEVDTWQIDITAQIQGRSGGSVVVYRNGSEVYNAPNHICDSSTTQCFWNFGPYMFFWPNTEAAPGWNDAGVNVQFRNMTLRRF